MNLRICFSYFSLKSKFMIVECHWASTFSVIPFVQSAIGIVRPFTLLHPLSFFIFKDCYSFCAIDLIQYA